MKSFPCVICLILLTLSTVTSSNTLVDKLFDLVVKESSERRLLASKVSKLENIIEKNSNTLKEIVKTVSTNNNDLKGIKNRIYGQSESLVCKFPIAFSARLDKGKVVPGNHIVIYDTVISDKCNTYSKHTGAFRCPVNGYYFFSFHLLDNASGSMSQVALRKNGEFVTQVWISGHRGYHRMGGNSAIIKLKKGDTVGVYAVSPKSAHMNSSGYGTFTGFRLV